MLHSSARQSWLLDGCPPCIQEGHEPPPRLQLSGSPHLECCQQGQALKQSLQCPRLQWGEGPSQA